MELQTTDVFTNLVKAAKTNRYLVFYGGSSSSKTISVLQYLLLYALKFPRKRIRIVAESIPVLKKGVIRDLQDVVMKEMWSDKRYNKSDMVYRFPNSSTFEFVPGSESGRFKGPRYNITYFDEVNHIAEEVYDQADIRTSHLVISTFNPTARFWLADRFEADKTLVHHSTVLDNPYIGKEIVDALKAKAETNQNFYKVYFLGEWGSLEGVIFEEGKHWEIVDDSKWPTEAKKQRIGLDWGYSRDPNAAVDLRAAKDGLFVKQVLYRKGLVNSEIADYLLQHTGGEAVKVIADSAEPKSIKELQKLGLDIHPSMKGPDSINAGINLLKEHKLLVTASSLELIEELRNYRWAEDKDGNLLGKPIDSYNHCIDAMRYAAYDMFNERLVKFI